MDVHNQPGALVPNMSQRWPTIIADFQELEEGSLSAKEIQEKLKISRAEAEVLETKQKLYLDWMKTFKDAVVGRYQRIKEMTEARKESVEQYKQWLKPYIARHKMINEIYENPEAAAEMSQEWYQTYGRSVGVHGIDIWAWKPVYAIEARKLGKEKEIKEFVYEPFDDVVKAMCFGGKIGNLNFKGPDNPNGKEKSLVEQYSWLTKEIVEKWAKNIKKDSINSSVESLPNMEAWLRGGPLDPYAQYYNFMYITYERGFESIRGEEYEDITWKLQNTLASQNAMMMKLLELKAAEENFSRQVDQILGIQSKEGTDIENLVKKDYPHLFSGETEEKTKEEAREKKG